MSAITYELKHYYQPTNNSCSQSSLAMLLSHYGRQITPEQIMGDVPVIKNDKGEDWGTINQQLATWCLSQGFNVVMHTADFEIIDLSWRSLDNKKLVERMELAAGHRNVPSLGKEASKLYMQSYIDFMQAGGELHIEQYMTMSLINDLLETGPILACVCFAVMYGTGRTKDVSLRKSEANDLDGKLANHTIVIYGRDEEGNYLVADPWRQPGRHIVEPQRLLAAMAAAQLECDNLIFQISSK